MPVQNCLLEELPSRTFKSVCAESRLVELTNGDVVCEPGERIRDVYFPTESFLSLVGVAWDACLEIVLVGDEGMVGVPLLLGADTKPQRVLVQGSGKAWCMKAEIFKRMIDKNRSLRRELHKYVLFRLAQLEQNAICARVHQVEARLARRLLMMQDRSHSDQFRATQESLASMLGVRRASVTCVAVTFQRKNLVQYRKGTLTVLDRKGLKRISCECYSAARAFRRLLQ